MRYGEIVGTGADVLSVLVVEDEAVVAQDVAIRLKGAGYDVLGPVATGKDAVDRARLAFPDVILMDIRIKGPIDGIEAAALIRNESDVPIIFATSYTDEQTLDRARAIEPEAIIFKPYDDVEVRTAIQIAVHRRSARRKLIESEQRFRVLFETNIAGVFRTTTEAVILDCNEAMARILGYGGPEELRNMKVTELYADPSVRAPLLQELRARGRISQLELELKRQDGTTTWVIVSLAVHNDGTVVGTAFDISRRKALDSQLSEQLRFQQVLLDTIPVPMFIRDAAGTYHGCNSAFAAFCGKTKEEIPGKTIEDLAPSRFAVVYRESDARLLSQDGVDVYETSAIDGRGVEHPMLSHKALFSTGTGGSRWIVGVLFDLTERKRAEREIRESEARFRLISENVQELIMLLGPDGVVRYASPSLHQFRQEDGAFVGRDLLQFIHPDDHYAVRSTLDAVSRLYENRIVRCRFHDRDRGWRTLETSLNLLVDDEQVVILAVARDITDRLGQEEEMRALRQAVDQAPLSVVMTDTDGTITYVNPAFTRISGYSRDEAIGQNPRILKSGMTPVEVYDNLWHTVISGKEWFGTLCNRRKDGSIYWEQCVISPVTDELGRLKRLIAIKGDITELVRKEEERAALDRQLRDRNAELESTVTMLRQTQDTLVQSEKLASIGQLTAGIAHEINNPLAFVASNLNRFGEYFEDVVKLLEGWKSIAVSVKSEARELSACLEEECRVDLPFVVEDFRRLLGHTQIGAGRIKAIVEQLRGFTHLSGNGFVDTNLNEALEETVTITWNELKYKATVVRDFAVLPLVCCNAGEIKQVFVNMLVNAAHALGGSGTITLRTRVEEESVKVEIEDTGEGIAAANVKKIFDPFFTTKPVGKGTGLGLWISSTIIRKHHGTIGVSSEPGKGTIFCIRIPVKQAETDGAGIDE